MVDDGVVISHGKQRRISSDCMNAVPTISIVTPSFNQAAFIGEAIASVRQQCYPFCEHVVIDGASRDTTVQILRKLSTDGAATKLRWISEPDRGQGHALNKGLVRSSGEIIGWLNSDDRYRPGAFYNIAATFQQHPEIDVIYGDYTLMDAAGHIQRVRREIEFSRFILLYHRVLYIPTTATFFRRRIIDDGNLLNETLHYALDFEFFVRLSAQRYRFMHLRQVLADFRLHGSSKTCTAPEKQLSEQRLIMRRYSPVTGRVSGDMAQKLTFGLLRSTAAALRYSQKLVRGYYFPELRSLTPKL
jgi:glycosyltransferase involved in cell wall biosynthesis